MCDNLGTIAFVGLAGTIFGTAHGAEPSSGTSVPIWVYAVILALMAALAAFGAWAAGRIRKPVTEAHVVGS
jgi:hypothetical protein